MEDIILYPGVAEDLYEATEGMKSEEIKMSTEVKTEIEVPCSPKPSDEREQTDPVIEEHDSTELHLEDSDIEEEFHAVQEKIANYKETKIKIEKIECSDIDPPLLIPEIQDFVRSDQSPLEEKPLLLLCRLCAIPSDDMIHIFGPTAFYKTLVEKIQQCLPITVKETDTLSTTACPLCLEKLEACYQFNKAVMRAEMKLRLYHEQGSDRLDEEIKIHCQDASQSRQQHIAMQNAVDGKESHRGSNEDAKNMDLYESNDLDHEPSSCSRDNQNTEVPMKSLKIGRTSAPQSEQEVCNSPPNSQMSKADSRKGLKSDETVTNSVNHPSSNTKKQSRRHTRTNYQGPTERSSYSLRKRKLINRYLSGITSRFRVQFKKQPFQNPVQKAAVSKSSSKGSRFGVRLKKQPSQS